MTGKSQAKTKCETLKWYPRNLWKRCLETTIFRSPLISASMLIVVG